MNDPAVAAVAALLIGLVLGYVAHPFVRAFHDDPAMDHREPPIGVVLEVRGFLYLVDFEYVGWDDDFREHVWRSTSSVPGPASVVAGHVPANARLDVPIREEVKP